MKQTPFSAFKGFLNSPPSSGNPEAKTTTAPPARAHRASARTNLGDALAKELTGGDVDKAVAVLREGMNASRHFWNGKVRGEFVTEPDWRVRVEAVKLVLSYSVGLPVQRSEVVNLNLDDSREIVERALDSPALQDAARRLIEAAASKKRAVEQK